MKNLKTIIGVGWVAVALGFTSCKQTTDKTRWDVLDDLLATEQQIDQENEQNTSTVASSTYVMGEDEAGGGDEGNFNDTEWGGESNWAERFMSELGITLLAQREAPVINALSSVPQEVQDILKRIVNDNIKDVPKKDVSYYMSILMGDFIYFRIDEDIKDAQGTSFETRMDSQLLEQTTRDILDENWKEYKKKIMGSKELAEMILNNREQEMLQAEQKEYEAKQKEDIAKQEADASIKKRLEVAKGYLALGDYDSETLRNIRDIIARSKERGVKEDNETIKALNAILARHEKK